MLQNLNLNERVLSMPPVRMDFSFARKGPLYIVAMLTALHDEIPSSYSGQATPRLNRCGLWRDPDPKCSKAFKGPVNACVMSGQALRRGNVMVCYRPLGEVPTGAPSKELEGLDAHGDPTHITVCGCVHTDGPLSQAPMESSSGHEMHLPDDHPARVHVRRWLVHALQTAKKCTETTIHSAANAYLFDHDCSLESSYALGVFIYGLLIGEAPDAKERT